MRLVARTMARPTRPAAKESDGVGLPPAPHRVPVLPGPRQGRLNHGLAEAAMLKLWFQRDAKLRSLIINVGETLTIWNQPHPTGPGSLTVHDSDDANICGQAKALCIDAYTRVLKDLHWPQ